MVELLTQTEFHDVVDPLLGVLGKGWSCHDEQPVENGWKFMLEWLPADEPEDYRVVTYPVVTFSHEDETEQVSDLYTAFLACVGAIFMTHAERKRHHVFA